VPLAKKLDHSGAVACARSIAADASMELPQLIEVTSLSDSSARGRFDALALKRAHHDETIHRQLLPKDENARDLFSILEQQRYESIGANAYAGVRKNLDSRFVSQAITRSRGDVLDKSLSIGIATEPLNPEQGITPDQLASWLNDFSRQSFREPAFGESVESDEPSEMALRWSPWLQKLKSAVRHQEAFAQLSTEFVAQLMKWIVESDSLSFSPEDNADEKEEVLDSDTDDDSEITELGESVQSDDREESEDIAAEGDSDSDDSESLPEQALDEAPVSGPDPTIEISGDTQPYTVFTTDFDEVAIASECASSEQFAKWRLELDDHIAVHGRLVRRLAARLQRVLLAQQKRHWQFDLEEGQLDPARLSRIISDPLLPLSFKEESDTAFRNTTITLLIDNSRSMLGRPIMIAAACADILARTLERCGVTVEILGFTTCHLHGGYSTEAWEQKGSPANPGRLNDLRHIIYKSADTPYRLARRNLGLMLDRDILKQNIDGEALSWAHARISKRPEQRKILMTISDGAPVDTSTLGANAGDYLARHLHSVIGDIEKSSPVELMAIGIGHDVGRFYSQAVSVFDARQLGPVMLNQLESLFRRAA